MNPLSQGSYTVKPRMLWLVSEHNSKSFDSLYFGPVPTEQITGILKPLWVESNN